MTKHRSEFSTSGLYNIIDGNQISGKLLDENSNKLNPDKLIDQHIHIADNTMGFSENMDVPGNLTVGQDIRVKGHIQADEITIDVRKIILNMDYGYIEEVIGKVQGHQLDQLLNHLDDLKLMIEKEKFKRS